MTPRQLPSLILQALAAAAVIAVLAGLGVWQVDRLYWKEALIARIAAAQTAPPIPAPAEWDSLDPTTMEYQPVTVSGHFLNDKEIFASTALTEPKGPRRGFGFFVMTPFQTDAGWIVYVNRGFIPREFKAPATRPGSQLEGETTVAGPLRLPYDRDWFAPGDDKAGNEWFSHDPKLYAAASGLGVAKVAPYIIDARFDPTLPNGLPQGGETIIDFPNNHLGYAITWFGLAAALAGVFGAYAWGKVRRGAEAGTA